MILTRASVIKIGQTLDAGQVIYGEFHVDGAELGDTSVKSPLNYGAPDYLKEFRSEPDLTEEGTLENISQMETRLAWKIAARLLPEGTPSEEEFFRDRPRRPRRLRATSVD